MRSIKGQGQFSALARAFAPTPTGPEQPRSFSRGAALMALLALCALVALGIAGASLSSPVPAPRPAATTSDLVMYKDIIADMRAGMPYYAAAVQEQRRRGYPLHPFLTVRLPTLAVAMAALPGEIYRRLAVAALGLAAILAGAWRAGTVLQRPLPAILALATGCGTAFLPPGYVIHEAWAGCFIVLSLALHGRRTWGLSLLAGLLAVSVREIAAPYLLVMAVLAWRDGARGQAAAWCGGMLIFALGLALHASAVARQVLPGDLSSPGWLGLGGWHFVVEALSMNIATVLLPLQVTACVAPFALFGMACWRGPISDRIALTVLGYCAAFLVVGRPDNLYWGLLIAPLWPLGVVGIAPLMVRVVPLAQEMGRGASGAD